MKSKTPKPIIVLEPGLPEAKLKEIRDAGYLPIVTGNPKNIKVVIPASSIISGDDVLMSFVHALSKGVYGATEHREAFAIELCKAAEGERARVFG